MKEFSRRNVLRLGTAMVAGPVVGELMIPVKSKVSETVVQLTDHPATNASYRQEIESCNNTADPQKCIQNYTPSFVGKVLNPIVEEFIFRAWPSSEVSISEGRKDHVSDVLLGTGGLGMTRRELLVGLVTSVVFGATHNVTYKGIDTKTIPASQTLGGIVYWYLQRKLGIFANALAHAWHNFRTMV